MKYFVLFALLSTAGCGVDGPPVAANASTTSGVTLSGCGAVGISNAPSPADGRPLC